MRTGRAGPRRAGFSRPRRRPLIYGLSNQQRGGGWGAKARRENWLFNLFTFDIQPPPQALILALLPPPHPDPGRPVRPARPSRAPGTTYRSPAPRRGEAQAAAGEVVLWARCTMSAHTSEGGGGVGRPVEAAGPGPRATVLAPSSPTPGLSPSSATGPRRPLGRWRRAVTSLCSPRNSRFLRSRESPWLGQVGRGLPTLIPAARGLRPRLCPRPPGPAGLPGVHTPSLFQGRAHDLDTSPGPDLDSQHHPCPLLRDRHLGPRVRDVKPLGSSALRSGSRACKAPTRPTCDRPWPPLT